MSIGDNFWASLTVIKMRKLLMERLQVEINVDDLFTTFWGQSNVAKRLTFSVIYLLNSLLLSTVPQKFLQHVACLCVVPVG